MSFYNFDRKHVNSKLSTIKKTKILDRDFDDFFKVVKDGSKIIEKLDHKLADYQPLYDDVSDMEKLNTTAASILIEIESIIDLFSGSEDTLSDDEKTVIDTAKALGYYFEDLSSKNNDLLRLKRYDLES